MSLKSMKKQKIIILQTKMIIHGKQKNREDTKKSLQIKSTIVIIKTLKRIKKEMRQDKPMFQPQTLKQTREDKKEEDSVISMSMKEDAGLEMTAGLDMSKLHHADQELIVHARDACSVTQKETQHQQVSLFYPIKRQEVLPIHGRY